MFHYVGKSGFVHNLDNFLWLQLKLLSCRKSFLIWYMSNGKWEGVDWMHLAQGKDQWWAVVKIVMNI